jgi:hypothetical protein
MRPFFIHGTLFFCWTTNITPLLKVAFASLFIHRDRQIIDAEQPREDASIDINHSRMAEEGEEVNTQEAAAVEESESFNVIDALKAVLKRSLIYDGLRRGLHE